MLDHGISSIGCCDFRAYSGASNSGAFVFRLARISLRSDRILALRLSIYLFILLKLERMSAQIRFSLILVLAIKQPDFSAFNLTQN